MMDVKSNINLERLLEQVILLNPTLKDPPDQLPLLNKKLEEQLVHGEAVVRIETMAFEPLCESLIRKINQLKCNLNPNQEPEKRKNEKTGKKSSEDRNNIKNEEFLSDSSDDEALIFKKSRSQTSKEFNSQVLVQTDENESRSRDVSSETMEVVPLSLQRTPRKRKRSSNFKYEYISPIKSGRSSRAENKCHRRNKHRKQETTVSTSGIVHYGVEDVVVEPGSTSRSFHIKIPSLFRDIVHELNISELHMARTVIDARAHEAKNKILQNENKHSSQNKKVSHKKREAITISDLPDSNIQQEKEDAEISQLINDVIGTEDETWQATNALQNINNEIIDNYDVMPGCSSPQEFLGFENLNAPKRRYNKTSNPQQPKKRGRKPKIKEPFQSQPPTKSNLAKYVENFSNDCDMRGSTTPAASSTMSQPLVSSTTQNYEIGTSPVMYYFDGNWENGDACQLVTTNGLSLDAAQIQSNDVNMTVPYGEATLNGNINLQLRHLPQTTDVQNSTISQIINIQIPPLPTNPATTTASYNATPPPAHTTAGVLDLSLKTNLNISNNSTAESINYNIEQEVPIQYQVSIDNNYIDDVEPLDLSVNATSDGNMASTSLSEHHDVVMSDSQCIVVDDGQDDDFIRRLIETSDFDLGLDQLHGGADDSKSFKAALDMPLLETIDADQDGGPKDVTIALQDDSTYASMNEESNFLSCTLGEDYHFADQSTKEIFHQLLEIDDTKSEIENTSKLASLPSDEVTFDSSGKSSTQTETTDSGGRDNYELNVNCQQENSDMMMKAEATSTKTISTDDKCEDNPTAVMKSIPRILKRRHTASMNIASPKEKEGITTNDPKNIVSSDSQERPKETKENMSTKEFDTSDIVGISKEHADRIVIMNEEGTISGMVSHKAIDTNETRKVKQQNVGSKHSMKKESNNHKSIKGERSEERKILKKVKDLDEAKEEVEDKYVDVAEQPEEVIHVDESKDLEADKVKEADNLDKVIEERAEVAFDEAKELKKVVDKEEIQKSKDTVDRNEAKAKDHGKFDGPNDEIISNCDSTKPTQTSPPITDLQNETEASVNTETSSRTRDTNKINENIKSDVEAQILHDADESLDEDNDFHLMEVIDINVAENCGEDDNFVSEHYNIVSTSKTNLPRERSVSCEADSSTFQNMNSLNENQTDDPCVHLEDSKNDEINSKEQNCLAAPTVTANEASASCVTGSETQHGFNVTEHLSNTDETLIINLCMPLNLTDHKLNYECDDDPQQSQNITSKELQNSKRNDQDEDDRYSIVNLNTNNCDRSIEESSECDNTSFAKQEKVVFSIAKINLKDDETTNLDYMFLSDSDNNSRKSCDENTQCNGEENLIEMQSQPDDLTVNTKSAEWHTKEDANTFPTLIVSDSEDDNEIEYDSISEDEGESWDKAFTNANPITKDVIDENIVENEGERQGSSNGISQDVTNNTIPDLHMSLLEMESKLEENTLNFEDDDDEDLDALILDTSSSCFDSPNEDRFKDSVVNVRDNNSKGCYAPSISIAATNTTNNAKKVDVPKLPSIDTIIQINAPKPPAAQALMKFKIPKLNISAGTVKPKEKQINQPTGSKSTITCANVPNIYDIKMQPFVPLERIPIVMGSRINVKDFNDIIKARGIINHNQKKYEKITRTIKNESATSSKLAIPQQKQLPQSANASVADEIGAQQRASVADKIGAQQQLQQIQQHFKTTFNGPPPAVSREQHLPSTSVFNNGHSGGREPLVYNGIHEIANIYGITCLPFLVNKCLVPTHCQKSHQFNDNEIVFSALNSLNKSQLYEAYNFMLRHSKLYSRFFVVFCNLYSMRNDRHKLLNMISDCGRYPEHVEFLFILYDALVKCGFSPPNACRKVLLRTRHTSTPIIDALVAIIMKSDWTMFSDYIENFAQDANAYHFRIEILEQMAPTILSGKQLHLNGVFWKCILTLHPDDLLCGRSPILTQCVELMASAGNVQQ